MKVVGFLFAKRKDGALLDKFIKTFTVSYTDAAFSQLKAPKNGKFSTGLSAGDSAAVVKKIDVDVPFVTSALTLNINVDDMNVGSCHRADIKFTRFGRFEVLLKQP